jgi:hypothetical protein
MHRHLHHNPEQHSAEWGTHQEENFYTQTSCSKLSFKLLTP